MAFDLSSIRSLLKKDVGASVSRKSVLGIDIGTSAIKIVQVKDVKGVPTLETYGELQLGPYEGVDLGRGTHLPVPKLAEALADIMREAGTTSLEVGLALSYNSSFTGTLLVPTLDPEQIATMVPVEARKYIPTSLMKVTLDWIVLGTHEKEKVTQILLSAIYNDAIARYEAIAKERGFYVSAREIEIFSSIRSIVAPADKAVAILDCGASSTRLYIVDKGVIRKTHSVLLSGTELTEAIAKEGDMEFAKAEELKRTQGLFGPTTDAWVQKSLTHVLDRGLRELRTVVQRHESEESCTVDRIILSGSGALLQGLPNYVQDMFSCPTSIAHPFSKMAYPAFLDETLKSSGPSFAVAIGIALRALQRN